MNLLLSYISLCAGWALFWRLFFLATRQRLDVTLFMFLLFPLMPAILTCLFSWLLGERLYWRWQKR